MLLEKKVIERVEYKPAGILQPFFCGAKEAERNLAFYSGFERIESRHCNRTFQDGDQYLDNWLIRARSAKLSEENTKTVLKLVEDLGFVINLEKSELKPTQQIVYLGAGYVLQEGIVRPAEERIVKLQTSLRKFLTKTVHTARVWQHVIGLLVAMEKLVPGGRLRIRPLQFELAKQWKQGIQDQNFLVKVTQEVVQAIEWWSQPDNVNIGTQLTSSRETVQIFTDTSLTGWGGHMGNLEIKGIWNREEQCLHINVLELKAVLNTVQQFSLRVPTTEGGFSSNGQHNSSGVHSETGSKSRQLFLVLQELFQFMEINDMEIKARHVPGRLNVWADELSRRKGIQNTEWSLHPQILEEIWKLIERPMIDLFATRHNNKRQMFV